MAKYGIKRTIRRVLFALPGGDALLRTRANYIEKRRFARIGDTKDVFRHHYESNRWGNDESVSGPGSTIQYTENIRKMLPPLLKELGVSVVLDAPCGDYNWFRLIEWDTPITYIGGDIVEPLVARSQSLYGSPHAKFIQLDIVHDALPVTDLWLCRDCLPHLSHRDVAAAIGNFVRSSIPYLLTSTYPQCDKNHDIPSGACRFLNFQLPPFAFGEPVRVIDDWIEGHPFRQLALWERETLAIRLASNRQFQRLRDSRG